MRVLPDEDEHSEVGLEVGNAAKKSASLQGEEEEILLAFSVQGLACLGYLMTVVEELDGLLEADGEEEADGDGADVDEEVSPSVVETCAERGRRALILVGCGCDELLNGILIIFEALLIHAHHSLVRVGLAGEDALLVDIGPAEAEAETLDGGASL